MTDKPQADQPRMETFRIPGTKVVTSRIGLGTWAIGGWMWGGTDEAESIRTIHAALDRGITLIDTAPVYGFGRFEEIVGKALAEGGRRAGVVLATKVALDWKTSSRSAMAAAPASRRRSTIRFGGCALMSSTSIKFIGRIRIPQSRKPRARWLTCSRPGRSGPSA